MPFTITNLISILVFRIFFHLFHAGNKYNPSLSTTNRIFCLLPKGQNEKILKSDFYVASTIRGTISVAFFSCSLWLPDCLKTVSIQLDFFFFFKILTFSECAFQGSKAQLGLTLAVMQGLFCFLFTEQPD